MRVLLTFVCVRERDEREREGGKKQRNGLAYAVSIIARDEPSLTHQRTSVD